MRHRPHSLTRPQLRSEDFRALLAAGTLKEIEGFASITITCERCQHFERFRPMQSTANRTRGDRSDATMHVASYHNTLLHEARALAELRQQEAENREKQVNLDAMVEASGR